MTTERTLIIVKPDGVRRGLVGQIIQRFERKGLRPVAMKVVRFDEALARRHYAEHVNKEFFPTLLEFIVSGPSVAMILEGPEAIALSRLVMGATNHLQAAPGTIRGDFGNHATLNLIHGSDSPERADVEIALFFNDDDIPS